jgi:tripartite-type tricarboxylate transporter receptor subunit TctC
MKKMLTAFIAGVLLSTTAYAAGYPDKPVTIIVPFPPGGSTDTLARMMTPKMGELMGQPFIVENKPGATGAIGAGQVKRSAPDGYTFMVASIGVYATNPFLQKNLAYDPTKDFDLMMVAVRAPNVLVTTPSIPANTVAELVDYLKKNPDRISFASSGAGSSDHLSIALFWQKTGTTGIHIPYKGGAPAISDLIAGHAKISFQNLNVVTGHIKAGKLKALAVTGEKRSPMLPDVPTLAESGISDSIVYSWQAIAAPKGLPVEVKNALHGAMVKTLKDPEVFKKLTDLGFEVVASTPQEFSVFLGQEMARWKQVIDAGRITLD